MTVISAALHVLISKKWTILPSHLAGRLENDVFSALRAGSEQLAVNKAEDHRLTGRLAGKINKYWHSLFFPSVHPMQQESVKVGRYSVKSHRRGEGCPQRWALALEILSSCPVVGWQSSFRRRFRCLKAGSYSRFALQTSLPLRGKPLHRAGSKLQSWAMLCAFFSMPYCECINSFRRKKKTHQLLKTRENKPTSNIEINLLMVLLP